MGPTSVNWKVGARERIRRDPELRALTIQDVQELLSTGDEEDRRVAHTLARGLMELEFETEAELLAQLRESIPA
jgi:hypothetical protein